MIIIPIELVTRRIEGRNAHPHERAVVHDHRESSHDAGPKQLSTMRQSNVSRLTAGDDGKMGTTKKP